jgi:Holliday junction resolvase
MQGAKGDMELQGRLIEAKSTTARSFSVKHEQLAKIAKEARDVGKRPALTVSFVTPDGRPIVHGEWVLMKLSDYRELTE